MFDRECSNALRNLSLPTTAADPGIALKEHIESSGCYWLFILDNCDQPRSEFDVPKYFPNSNTATVLITTRLDYFTSSGETVHVDKMELNEGLDLLFTQAGLSKEVTAAEDISKRAINIVEDLGRLALTIDICGSYIRYIGDSTLEKYIAQRGSGRWRTFRAALGNAPLHARSVDYPNSVLIT